uniref:PMS1 homolog 2, mismatch repair system component n=1 Tax=Homo sapiens TaxID=9606 RepID=A0A8V8TNW1_HUMAN
MGKLSRKPPTPAPEGPQSACSSYFPHYLCAIRNFKGILRSRHPCKLHQSAWTRKTTACGMHRWKPQHKGKYRLCVWAEAVAKPHSFCSAAP